MKLGSRSGVVLFVSSLAWGTMTLGCLREKESDQILATAGQSLEGLKPKVAELQRAMSEVHKAAEEISEDVPGGLEFRQNLFSREEVLGVLDGKLKWLTGELESAKKSGKKADAVRIQEEVTRADAEVAAMGKMTMQLAHESTRLQRDTAVLKAGLAKLEAYKKVLPSGYEVKGREDGLESRLVALLADPQKKADKKTWLPFDGVVFTGGGSDINVELSKTQLVNVAEILDAYPGAKLKLAGYKDGGDAAANKKLSDDRALALKSALTQMRVGEKRLGIESFRAGHSVCDARETECVALQVAAK